MQPFIAAVIVSIGLAVGAAWLLDSRYQVSSSEAFVTGGARVSHPGDNLIGGAG